MFRVMSRLWVSPAPLMSPSIRLALSVEVQLSSHSDADSTNSLVVPGPGSPLQFQRSWLVSGHRPDRGTAGILERRLSAVRPRLAHDLLNQCSGARSRPFTPGILAVNQRLTKVSRLVDLSFFRSSNRNMIWTLAGSRSDAMR